MTDAVSLLLGGIGATLLWETAGADWLENRKWRQTNHRLPMPERKVLALIEETCGALTSRKRKLICAQWLGPEDQSIWYGHFQGLLSYKEGRFFIHGGPGATNWWEIEGRPDFGSRKPEDYWYEVLVSDVGKLIKLKDWRVLQWRDLPSLEWN